MDELKKLYHAIIWKKSDGTELPGLRVTTVARNLDEANEQLEQEYGKGNVYCLYNKEDAEKPR